MKYAIDRPYADPEAAARKLIEIANSVEAVQEGRIHNEFEDPILEVLVDRYQIQQIIINPVNKTTPIACWEGGINWRAAAAGACGQAIG